MARDLYEVLGVSRQATQDEIKKAYRRLAKKYHPDVNPGNKGAEASFKEVTSAFEALGEPEPRKLYDEFGEDALRPGFDAERARQYKQWREQGQAGGGGGGGASPFGQGFPGGFPGGFQGGFNVADIFDLFNQEAPGRARTTDGDDVEHDLDLDLAKALHGGEFSLTFREPVSCPVCHGNPAKARTCTRCHGRGLVTEDRTIRVRIPARVPDGARLRIPGEGERATSGGKNGDLYLVIHVRPHADFRLTDGRDLHVDLPVSVPEAVLGARVGLILPDGSSVKVRVPPGSQSGQRLRLKGMGLGRKGERGDLYSTVQVKVPRAANPEVARLVEELRKHYGDEMTSPVRDLAADAAAPTAPAAPAAPASPEPPTAT